MQKHDPGIAMEMLKKQGDKNPIILGSCHELLHELGRASYRKYHDLSKIETF